MLSAYSEGKSSCTYVEFLQTRLLPMKSYRLSLNQRMWQVYKHTRKERGRFSETVNVPKCWIIEVNTKHPLENVPPRLRRSIQLYPKTDCIAPKSTLTKICPSIPGRRCVRLFCMQNSRPASAVHI